MSEQRWRYYMRAGMEGRHGDLNTILRVMPPEYGFAKDEPFRRFIAKGMRRAGYAASHGGQLHNPKRGVNRPRQTNRRPSHKPFMAMTAADHRMHDLFWSAYDRSVDVMAEAISIQAYNRPSHTMGNAGLQGLRLLIGEAA